MATYLVRIDCDVTAPDDASPEEIYAEAVALIEQGVCEFNYEKED